jgi:DNA polymerase I-like protein with 3'-5' exonuclease and polymerase domains
MRGSETCLPTGEDIHSDNAIELYGRLPNVRALHVNGLSFRDNAKKWVHASDYAGGARTISQAISLLRIRLRGLAHWWTKIRHPEIGEWHKRIEWDLTRSRTAMVRNAFGFRRMYADPNAHNILNQALAWICQSTVAVVINKAMLNVDCARDLMGRPRCGECLKCAYYDYAGPDFNLLLQIHDSLLLQVREDLIHDTIHAQSKSAMESRPLPRSPHHPYRNQNLGVIMGRDAQVEVRIEKRTVSDARDSDEVNSICGLSSSTAGELTAS